MQNWFRTYTIRRKLEPHKDSKLCMVIERNTAQTSTTEYNDHIVSRTGRNDSLKMAMK
jgi:hypothetical protein